jgi:hypothetical protein
MQRARMRAALTRRMGTMEKLHFVSYLNAVPDSPLFLQGTGPPFGRGRGASKPVQGRLECAYRGTWEPGRVPTDKDSRAYGRSYRQVVQLPCVPFQGSVIET